MSLDFSEFKSLTVAGVALKQLFINGVQVWKSGPKNWVRYSTEADGKTIYNGGLGYKNNTRLNSSAADVGKDGYATVGYIPVKAGDLIRLKGLTWSMEHNSNCYFWAFDANRTKIKYLRPEQNISDVIWTNEGNGVVAFDIQSYATSIKYIRLSAFGSGENAIITINEEIPA